MPNPIAPVPYIPPPAETVAAPASTGDRSAFFQTLNGVMSQVDALQSDASTKVSELLQGNGQDLHTAMIAVQKADLTFQLMMQVRNKIIAAYQTISQLPF
jgi:flagellar hook-basal body complex protein FliE